MDAEATPMPAAAAADGAEVLAYTDRAVGPLDPGGGPLGGRFLPAGSTQHLRNAQ